RSGLGVDEAPRADRARRCQKSGQDAKYGSALAGVKSIASLPSSNFRGVISLDEPWLWSLCDGAGRQRYPILESYIAYDHELPDVAGRREQVGSGPMSERSGRH